MEFRIFKCKHCGREEYYLEAMLMHLQEKHSIRRIANELREMK